MDLIPINPNAEQTSIINAINENFRRLADGKQNKGKSGVTGPYWIYFNNGTGTRSTVTTEATMPGATGDTSYTAPAHQNVTLHLTMTQMTDRTAGTTQCWISIDGTKQGQATYAGGTDWEVQTTHLEYDVDAGVTVTIGCRWQNAAGTGTVTNDSNDYLQFPNHIIYVAVPRND